MDDRLTDGELTLLGLLAEEPRHGYDLDRVIEQRGIRLWTSLGFSSIYYLIDRLAGRGLIEVVATGAGRRRTVYRPTAEGYELLAAQCADAIEALTPVRARILIGMANSPILDPADMAERLSRRAERLSAELDQLRRRRAGQQPLPDFVEAIFGYGEAMILADLHWTRHLREKGRAMTTPDTGGATAAGKYDIKVARRELYAPSAKDFSLVEVPRLTYLALDGSGDPNTSAEYATAVEALYTVAYSIKAHSRKAGGRDFVVAPLEGLWWADDMTAFARRDKAAWHWTMLIAVPDWITGDDVETARANAQKKKDLPAIDALEVRTLDEGACVQILHIGSYDDEGPVLDRLHHTYLPEHGLTARGHHHEIYLNDARRTEPAKLKTILRQPVTAA